MFQFYNFLLCQFCCVYLKQLRLLQIWFTKGSSGVFSLSPSETPRSLTYLFAFVLLILYFLCVYSVASSNEG